MLNKRLNKRTQISIETAIAERMDIGKTIERLGIVEIKKEKGYCHIYFVRCNIISKNGVYHCSYSLCSFKPIDFYFSSSFWKNLR